MVVRNLAFEAASLRDARWAAVLSVAGLAAVLDVSVAAVKSWEAGRRTPRAAVLPELIGVR